MPTKILEEFFTILNAVEIAHAMFAKSHVWPQTLALGTYIADFIIPFFLVWLQIRIEILHDLQ